MTARDRYAQMQLVKGVLGALLEVNTAPLDTDQVTATVAQLFSLTSMLVPVYKDGILVGWTLAGKEPTT